MWLLAAAFLSGCGFTDSAPRCEMGQEHTIAQAAGLGFDDLALTTHGERTFAVWSDAAGLYAATLTKEGSVALRTTRIGQRCAGGIAAVSHDAGAAVACVRPFNGDADHGQTSLIELNESLSIVRTRVLGDAGRASQGVDIAQHAGELAVVWQDSAIDHTRLLLWRGSHEHQHEPEALILSSPQSVPAEPSLTWVGKRLFVMWSEASTTPSDRERRLVLSRGDGAPTVVTTVMHEDPTPRLRELNGELYLAFRDKRGGRKPGLYVSKVSDRGSLHGELSRLSRADAKAGPAIVPCFDGLLAVAPRTFGGGKFVGINWVDKTLTRASQERQFYEDSRQFALAAGACVGDHALLLIGEQGRPERPVTKLRSVGFRCQ
jgi:hypothetical protein